MKDSGIEWIGEIPESWGITRIGNYYSFSSGDTLTNEKISDEGDYVVYGANGIRGFYNKYNLSGQHILIGRVGALCGNIHITNSDVWVTEHALICYSKTNVCNPYFGYVFSAMNLGQYSKASAQPVISSDTISRLRMPIPSQSEQQAISAHLDRQCGLIDNIIEKTKASIEEYKKLRQAVITQAVTKGVRGDRPMKDSGIEWIGEIPEDWSRTNAHRIVIDTQNGLTRRDLDKSEGQIVLKLKNISASGEISYNDTNRIELSDDEFKRYSLQEGDFLFVRVNGTKSLVGKCAIYRTISEPVAYNDHIIRVRLNDLIDKKYFQYYLLCNAGRTEIDLRTSTAAGQFTISGEGLRNINIIIPSIEEQKEIAAYLYKKCSEIDSLISKKKQFLTELESYKKSMIYEYVTGKKEVPQS